MDFIDNKDDNPVRKARHWRTDDVRIQQPIDPDDMTVGETPGDLATEGENMPIDAPADQLVVEAERVRASHFSPTDDVRVAEIISTPEDLADKTDADASVETMGDASDSPWDADPSPDKTEQVQAAAGDEVQAGDDELTRIVEPTESQDDEPTAYQSYGGETELEARNRALLSLLPSPENDYPGVVAFPENPNASQGHEGDFSAASVDPSFAHVDPSAAPVATSPIIGQQDVSGLSASDERILSQNKKRRRWPLVLLAIVIAFALVYVAGMVFYSSRFFPNTTVNGQDVSNMTVAELSSYITDLGARYQIHVTGEDMDLTVSGKEIDFTYDGNAYGTEAQSQIDNSNWLVSLTRPHAYTVKEAFSFDEEKLVKIVGAAVDAFNKEAQAPTNAKAVFDEASTSFKVQPEAIGTMFDRDKVISKVVDAVSAMSSDVELDYDELQKPEVGSDDKVLLDAIDKANGIINSNVVIRIADRDAAKVEPSRVCKWVSVTDDYEVKIDRDAIASWTKGALSEEFDTAGNKRTYKRPDGKKFTIEGGTYGWILNGDELANTLVDHYNNGNFDPIDSPMYLKAAKWNPDGKEWPNRYIDADLSEQHVRMYDENKNIIWESDCVSGNTSLDRGTCTGAYYIQDKESPKVLVGLDEDGDGQPDYESPVTYWMPFNGGYGLHDANWRYSFGGTIYTSNGSHGCINLPVDKAAELYNLVNVGDVVVVHY